MSNLNPIALNMQVWYPTSFLDSIPSGITKVAHHKSKHHDYFVGLEMIQQDRKRYIQKQ